MDFKDWRKATQASTPEGELVGRKYQGRRFSDHIEEQIQAAQERGSFDNLPGMGQPLQLDVNVFAGEKALGYSLLKNNGFAPAEVELSREIRQELERLEKLYRSLSKRGQDLRRRAIAPFASEKRAYDRAVLQALKSYEARLQELNRKIQTLNLTAPAPMHRPALEVEPMVEQFKQACPLFDL